MKALGIVLLAAVIGFLGYQVAYPKIFDPTFFPKDPTQFTETKTKAPPVVETPKVAEVKKEEPKSEEPMAKPEPKPEPKAETPAPAMAAAGEGVKKEEAPEDPNVFHPPVFPPLDQVVKDWKEIPKQVFPRPVVLHKGVEFVMSIGKSKVGPGGTALAVDQVGDNLVVAPAANSPAHSEVALDDTNLKEILNEAYETWKVQMVEYKKRQFEFKLHAAERKASEPPSKGGAPTVAASNDKPKRDGDGTYPVLLNSMKTGQVTEITPTNIKKWGEAAQEKIDGKNYWTVIVNYTTKTMFGDFDTEAQARIFNGKVEKWVYTGSGEVVP
jgi:hypothetical protein